MRAAALFDPKMRAAFPPDPEFLEKTLDARDVLADGSPSPPPPSFSDSPASAAAAAAAPEFDPPNPKNSALPAEEGMRMFHPRPLPFFCSEDESAATAPAPPSGVASTPPLAPAAVADAPAAAAAAAASVSLAEKVVAASTVGTRFDELEFHVATLAAAMGGAGVPLVTGPVFVGVALSCGWCVEVLNPLFDRPEEDDAARLLRRTGALASESLPPSLVGSTAEAAPEEEPVRLDALALGRAEVKLEERSSCVDRVRSFETASAVAAAVAITLWLPEPDLEPGIDGRRRCFLVGATPPVPALAAPTSSAEVLPVDDCLPCPGAASLEPALSFDTLGLRGP